MATTTLAGNSGNNLLNAPGLDSTLVQGLAGNDTITLALVNDEAEGGAGNDTIGLTKTGTLVNVVDGGAGNDTITFLSATVNSQTISGGAGNDSIKIGGTSLFTGVQIAGNAGNDTIQLATGARTIVNSYVGLGQGNDTVDFGGGTVTFTTSDLFAGKGKDTLTIASTTSATSSTLNGGQGADLIDLSGSGALTSMKIGAGKGADSIAMNNGISGSVAGGALNDTISLGATALGAVTIFGDANGVTTAGTGTGSAADGADLIGSTTATAGASTIYGGGGSDTIKFTTSTGVIDGGDGTDSIYLTKTNVGAASVNGGAGADTITLLTGASVAASGLATVNGGAGNDVINFNGIAGAATGLLSSTALLTFVVAGASSGDKINLTNSGIAISTASSTAGSNWAQGVSTLYVGSAANVAAVEEGSISVFTVGTDTYFSVAQNTTTTNKIKFVVKGVDLITTTKTGEVTFSAANFGFTLAEYNGSQNTGISLTLS